MMKNLCPQCGTGAFEIECSVCGYPDDNKLRDVENMAVYEIDSSEMAIVIGGNIKRLHIGQVYGLIKQLTEFLGVDDEEDEEVEES